MNKSLLFFLLLSLSITVNAQENKFNKACKKNTIEAYNEFLDKYPISGYTEQAAFRKALLINTAEAFNSFLLHYPSGSYYRQADSILCYIGFDKIRDTNDPATWEAYFAENRNCPGYGPEIEKKLIMVKFNQAGKINTIQAYRQFLDSYPDCEYREQAMKDIQQIEFEDLKKANSISIVKNYIDENPGGYFIPDIKDYLESLEFNTAVKSESVDSIVIFLTRYPMTKFNDKAQQKLEELEFNEASQKNTLDSYTDFLEKYPSGIHAMNAKNEIDQINFYYDPVVRRLQSNDPQEVESAIAELGSTRNPLAVEPLILAYKEQSIYRREIAEALVKIGDSSVLPLIGLINYDEFNYNEASDAIWALGEIKDKRAAQPLVAVLDEYFYLDDAAEALGKINDTTIIPQLINDLFNGDYDDKGVGQTLAKMGAKQAIPVMYDNLTVWDNGKRIAGSLLELGWKPTSPEDEIHPLIAQEDWPKLRYHWEDTRKILLSDANSGNPDLVENAVNAFISIGRKEIIPDLKSILHIQGNVSMAETYLNCGNGELEDAARIWAEDHGYTVSSSYGGGGAASWGGN